MTRSGRPILPSRTAALLDGAVRRRAGACKAPQPARSRPSGPGGVSARLVLRQTRCRSPGLHLLDFRPVTAGYSKTPLVRKLGIKPGFRIHLRDTPDDFDQTLGALPAGVEVRRILRGDFDLIHFFCDSRRKLDRCFPRLKEGLRRTGALWISWPKKAAGRVTDLSGGEVRRIGLRNGLVDIKVCAVDDIWSGLKFVYRKSDRRSLRSP